MNEVSSSLPSVMAHAEVDLLATVEGRFTAEDWGEILKLAERKWLKHRTGGLDNQPAWQEVVRDFHQQRYWGFLPVRKKIHAARKPMNLGIQLIWLTFNSFVVMKVAVLWFGQIYSRSDEVQDKWIFFLVLSFAAGNLIFFLWRNHAHPD